MDAKFDKRTKAWMRKHVCQQTTVCKCNLCGLFYKPSLGHDHKKQQSVKSIFDGGSM